MTDTEKITIYEYEYENAPNYIGMFCFFDKKAKRNDVPFFCKTDLNAKRHFIMMIRKEGTMLNSFKNEFDLIRLGYFDNLTQEYIPFTEKISSGEEIAYKEE